MASTGFEPVSTSASQGHVLTFRLSPDFFLTTYRKCTNCVHNCSYHYELHVLFAVKTGGVYHIHHFNIRHFCVKPENYCKQASDDDRCYYKVATLFKFTTVHMFSAIIFPRNGRHNVGCMVRHCRGDSFSRVVLAAKRNLV